MPPAMDVDELQAFLDAAFPSELPYAVEEILDTGVRLRLYVGESNVRPGGTVSGPSLMALADCAAWLAVVGQIGPVALAVTTNLNINFLRKPEAGDLIGHCRLLKLGKRLAVGEVTIVSEGSDEPVAHAVGTYSIPAR